ncbi:MAG: hypothetical protein IKN05_05935, partial [Clostridia bacterium]|nr:hypothetical protein [Clostridia bacterium]
QDRVDLPAAFDSGMADAPLEEVVEEVIDGNDDDMIDSIPDSDDLFAGYVRRFFYGGGRRVLMATNNAGRQLSGQDRVIYSALKQAIVRIANGDLSSTVVRIPVTDVLGKLCFTASDLGVIVEYGEDRRPTQDSLSALYAAFWNQYTYHFNRILDALWCDCTYELYWFDRYNAPVPVPKRPSAIRVFDHDSGEYAVCHREGDADITISLPVLQQYAAKDSENNIVEYAIDTGVIAGAKAAAANAQAIVDRYADCSDYAKLFGYAHEICKRVTYNNAAARDTWELTDQNPWKLIWVFDGDPETNVVCEGYAMAFSYLCERSSFDSGVRCFMVSGNASGPHAWNIVRMGDGSNYLVDVTWMDGAWVDTLSGGLADWISQQKGHSLFLAGGTGSVEGGYTVQYRTGSNTTRRTYDANTLGCYTASNLALASAPYTLNSFQSIGGDTYYFDDGVYVTGNRTIDGTAYGFGESGVLAATWTVGWHTIDGVDYYFDANGLHTHHSVEALAPVPATCTDTGLTEGKRCRECGAVLVEQDVEPALGHVWGALRFTLSGDKQTMTAARTCLRDATHIQSETANTVASIAQAPTCSDMGATTYTAAFLSPDFPRQTRTIADIPALGHDWSAPVYAWSDDNRTVTAIRTCKRAGCAETQSETVAVSSEVTRAATCAEAGETTYTGAEFANRAFAVQTRALENIPALSHDLAHHAARAATCTETGWSAYDACSRCDYTTY